MDEKTGVACGRDSRGFEALAYCLEGALMLRIQ